MASVPRKSWFHFGTIFTLLLSIRDEGTLSVFPIAADTLASTLRSGVCMALQKLLLVFIVGVMLIATACFASRTCYSPEDAASHAGKEICLSAHVYDVVENQDGTRYLDVCKPGVPDESCRFTIVSLAADRKEVGELNSVREQDIHLRGQVISLHGESIMVLSHARQFHDGPAKFRPNPDLMKGFDAEDSSTAFKEPSLSARSRKSSSVFSGAATAVH
jgi:hypothetical protein